MPALLPTPEVDSTPTAEPSLIPFNCSKDTETWGEIVSWSHRGADLRHKDLVDALAWAELDTTVARALLPRNAWLRACRKLETDRIIRQLESGSGDEIHFQFTKEKAKDARYAYDFEAIVVLNTKTGAVTCTDKELEAKAQSLLDDCMEKRTGADITRVIQRLFEKNADLFPVREQGGCYFVPKTYAAFLDKVYLCVSKLNGRMPRFPVPKGTVQGDRSVQDAMVFGIEALIEEHKKAVSGWDEETRNGTISRAVSRVLVTKKKIIAYADYLGTQKDELLEQLADIDNDLREKVVSLGKTLPSTT